MPEHGSSGWTRREVLLAGAAGVAIAPAAVSATPSAVSTKRLILIVCNGGPSQLETWDPKPDAPSEVRGPFGAIDTAVPGLRVSELLPSLASLADRFALIRSLHLEGPESPALHETGLQRLHTGTSGETLGPSLGARLSANAGKAGELPPYVLLPRPLSFTGVELPHGEGSGPLSPRHGPTIISGVPHAPGYAREAAVIPPGAYSEAALCGDAHERGATESYSALRRALDVSSENERAREAYGRTEFGQSCLVARRLVERGVRCVTINQFPTLFNTTSWDCHGYPDLPTRLADLRDVAAPFDRAVAALIADLCDRGLYADTVVCCLGEFGRTPRITRTGGRDHWTRCWSAMLGGGGIRGGQVIGESDAHAAEPREHAVIPAELTSTLMAALGLNRTPASPVPGLL